MSITKKSKTTTTERDALARRGLVLVEAEARRFWYRCRRRIDLDELRSIGREALVHALDNFDPSRGRFEGYALARIRGAMKDEARKRRRRRVRSRPTIASLRPSECAAPCRRGLGRQRENRSAAATGAHRGEPGTIVPGGDLAEIAMCDQPDPEAAAVARNEAQIVREIVAGLPQRQRRFIERHYFAGEPMGQLRRDFGVSRHALRRLHVGSLDTMGRHLRRRSRFVLHRPISEAKGRTAPAPSSPG